MHRCTKFLFQFIDRTVRISIWWWISTIVTILHTADLGRNNDNTSIFIYTSFYTQLLTRAWRIVSQSRTQLPVQLLRKYSILYKPPPSGLDPGHSLRTRSSATTLLQVRLMWYSILRTMAFILVCSWCYSAVFMFRSWLTIQQIYLLSFLL